MPVRTMPDAKPLGPSSASAPSRTPSKAMDASIDDRVPRMSSIGVTVTPGASRGTSSATVLAGPFAKTRNRSARCPLVVHFLRPSSRQPPPSGVAVVVIAAVSLPAPGSDRQNAPRTRPLASSGPHRCCCASVPKRSNAQESMVCTVSRLRTDEQPAADLLVDFAEGDHVQCRRRRARAAGTVPTAPLRRSCPAGPRGSARPCPTRRRRARRARPRRPARPRGRARGPR